MTRRRDRLEVTVVDALTQARDAFFRGEDDDLYEIQGYPGKDGSKVEGITKKS